MSLLQWLFGDRRPPSVSFDDDPVAACLELHYRAKKQIRKMERKKARAALKGEIIRMGLRDAKAVAIYNKAHPQEPE